MHHGNDTSDQTDPINPTGGAGSGSDETDSTVYDADGNVISSADAKGVYTKTTYNEQGEPTFVYSTDGAGGDPTSVTDDVVFSQQEFTYDADGNTIQAITRTRLASDSSGDTGPLGTATSGVLATVDDVVNYYDAADRVTDMVDLGTNETRPDSVPDRAADIEVTHTDYDADGNVQDTIDPTGVETYYTTNAAGETTQEIDNYNLSIASGAAGDSANVTTDYTYNGDGNELTQTAEAPSGQTAMTTDYVYGTGATADDILTTENPDPVTGDASTAAIEDESATFDNVGDQLTETDPDGEVQDYTIDDLGRTTMETIATLGADESGLVRAMGYTFMPDGQPAETTDYSNTGATTVTDQTEDVYDDFGQESDEYDSQSGAVDTSTTPETVISNDPDEETGDTDPLGATTADTYQGENLTKVTQTGHDIPATENYDPSTGAMDSLQLWTSGTVGSGTPETTTWTYDPASGQMTSKTYADSTEDTYAYNAKQQLETETRPGETIGYTYTPSGDSDTTIATDSTTGTTVTDTNGYDSATGQLTSTEQDTTDGVTTTTAANDFTYTDQGNVKTETQAGGVTTEYTYFADGTNNPGAIETVKLVQGGTTISETDYTYDTQQRLDTITASGQTFTIGYQSGTNEVATVSAADASVGYTYDPDTGNLTGIASGTVYSASYVYNDNNQRTGQTVSQTNADASTTAQNYAFGYDTDNQLASVTDTDTSTVLNSYSYDGAGNRNDSAFTAIYGTASTMNQYSGVTYNDRGDVTDDGTFSYTWNAKDQLIGALADDGSVKLTFQYDGQGRRIEKDVYTPDGEDGWTLSYTRQFVYDGQSLVAELDGDGNIVTSYAYGPTGNLLTVTDHTGDSPVVYMAVLDENNNLVSLINSTTGDVAATYTYDPYGKLLTATGPAEGVSNILSDEGYYDRETDTVLDEVRFVNLRLDKWMSRDPIGEAGGKNTTVYCQNDPINLSDSAGLDADGVTAAPTVAPTTGVPAELAEAQALTDKARANARAEAASGIGGLVLMGVLRKIGDRASTLSAKIVDRRIGEMLFADFHAGKLSPDQVNALYNNLAIVPANSGSSQNQNLGPDNYGDAMSVTKAWWAWYQAELALYQAQIAVVLKSGATAAPATQPSPAGAITPAATPSPSAGGAGASGPPAPPTSQSTTQPSKNYINLSTTGLTPNEIVDLKEYVRRTNAWLAVNNGTIVKSTAKLAAAKTAAVRAEKDRMAASGTPFPASGAQLGHVPDTALSGEPDPMNATPPGSWLVMHGKSNSVAGGALGPLAPNKAGRVGQHVDGFTVDGSLP